MGSRSLHKADIAWSQARMRTLQRRSCDLDPACLSSELACSGTLRSVLRFFGLLSTCDVVAGSPKQAGTSPHSWIIDFCFTCNTAAPATALGAPGAAPSSFSGGRAGAGSGAGSRDDARTMAASSASFFSVSTRRVNLSLHSFVCFVDVPTHPLHPGVFFPLNNPVDGDVNTPGFRSRWRRW